MLYFVMYLEVRGQGQVLQGQGDTDETKQQLDSIFQTISNQIVLQVQLR